MDLAPIKQPYPFLNKRHPSGWRFFLKINLNVITKECYRHTKKKRDRNDKKGGD